jgi:type IV pilus assembly protein PilN
MYSLDVNFLKDRSPEQIGTPVAKKKSKAVSVNAMAFMVGGLIVGGVLIGLSVAGLFLVKAQKSAIEAEIAELEQEIQVRTAQNQKMKELEDQIAKAESDNAAFVSVFEQVRPWSAILQDIKDRIPQGVQIDSIAQETTTQEDGTEILALNITGNAITYRDLEAFIISLKKSDFLNSEKTYIEKANLVANPITVELSEAAEEAGLVVELPEMVVGYTVKAELTKASIFDLLRELDSKGAVGLSTRIRILEQKGAIQQ